MRFGAKVDNGRGRHDVTMLVGDQENTISIPPKPNGFGSSASGGELLFLALATCYCNDIYREAARRGIEIERVEVEAEGEFAAEGAAATDVKYQVVVTSNAPKEDLHELMLATDRVAEIQNTLRVETPVELQSAEIDPAT